MNRNADMLRRALPTLGCFIYESGSEDENFTGGAAPVVEPLNLHYVNDQMIENGQEAICLIDDHGEVHATIYRLGVNLFRAVAARSIRRFIGLDNAKAFVQRKLTEAMYGVQLNITDGGSFAEADSVRELRNPPEGAVPAGEQD